MNERDTEHPEWPTEPTPSPADPNVGPNVGPEEVSPNHVDANPPVASPTAYPTSPQPHVATNQGPTSEAAASQLADSRGPASESFGGCGGSGRFGGSGGSGGGRKRPARHTRVTLLAWSSWLLGSWAMVLQTAGLRESAPHMLLSVWLGLGLVFPCVRLSVGQTAADRRHARGMWPVPAHWVLMDMVHMLLIAQAVVWPLMAIGQWSLAQTLWLNAWLWGWGLLVAAAVTLFVGRKGPWATIGMAVCLALWLGEPASRATLATLAPAPAPAPGNLTSARAVAASSASEVDTTQAEPLRVANASASPSQHTEADADKGKPTTNATPPASRSWASPSGGGGLDAVAGFWALSTQPHAASWRAWQWQALSVGLAAVLAWASILLSFCVQGARGAASMPPCSPLQTP